MNFPLKVAAMFAGGFLIVFLIANDKGHHADTSASKAAYTVALHRCWARANEQAAKSGYKIPEENLRGDYSVGNVNWRDMHLTLDQQIEEKTCEAKAKLDAMTPQERSAHVGHLLGLE